MARNAGATRSESEQQRGDHIGTLSPLYLAMVKSAALPSQHRRRIALLIIGA